MWWKAMSAAALLVTASGGATLAQGQDLGRVEGTVVDESGRPVANAQIILLEARDNPSGNHQAGTRDDGRFTLSNVPTGSWWALVRRVGHVPQRLTFDLGTGETETLAITLPSAAFVLPELAVVEQGVTNRLLAFSSEVRNGYSRWFYTREAIEQMNPKDMRDLTRRALPFLGPHSYNYGGIGFANDMPGSPYTVFPDYVGRSLVPGESPFRILPTFASIVGGGDPFEHTRAATGNVGFQRVGDPQTLGFAPVGANRRCVPQFYLNGQLMAIPINNIDPHALEAVEVFRPGRVPLLIDPTEGRGGCGVILAWLRSDWLGGIGTGTAGA